MSPVDTGYVVRGQVLGRHALHHRGRDDRQLDPVRD